MDPGRGRGRCLAAFLAALFGIQGAQASDADKPERWLVYYSDRAPVEQLTDYDLVALDSQYHPPLQGLNERGVVTLGYISLGEVEDFRPHFEAVRDEGLLLVENEYWPGSWMVDMRDPRWTRRVIEELIPAILNKGFDGIIMDTLDNAAWLERRDPERYAGMTEAAADLVLSIRRHFPQIRIMMNRGYEVLPRVAESIDYALGESVYADYDFENDEYDLVETDLYRRQVEILQQAQAQAPELTVVTLDYWDPEDRAGIARIYEEQRANGFVPYVATIDLAEIVEPPSP